MRDQLYLRLKARVGLQFCEASGNIGLGDVLQFVSAEGFAGVAGSNAAVDDGLNEVGKGGLGLPIGAEPAGHAAKEAVTSTGGVKDGVQWVGGAGEEVLRLFTKEVTAVLATLDDDKARAFGLQLATGFDEVGGLGELLGLAVVDDEEIDLFHDVMQALIGDADPEIHGIGNDEVSLSELFQGLHLIVGTHVGQNSDLSRGSGGVEFWQPGFQHIDADGMRGAIVHVLMVFTAPGEGGATAALEAIQGDAFAAE